MRRTAMAIALALVVVTAGCSGVMQDEGTPTAAGSDGGSTPTATPTATPTPSGLPPGVTEDGLENWSALLDAQRSALDESGYVASASANVTLLADGETIISQTSRSRARYEAGGTGVYERSVTNSSLTGNSTRLLWANSSVSLSRTYEEDPFSNETTMKYTNARDPDPRIGTTEAGASVQLLQLLQFDLTGEDGGRITLTATGVNRTAFEDAFGEDGNVSDATATLVVDRSGRIRSFEGRLVVEPGSKFSSRADTVVVESSYRLESVGDVDVERPDWVSTALEEVTLVDATVEVVDGEYVAVTNDGPDPIPADTMVGLTSDGSGTLTRLSDPVAPGETVYVYLPADSDRTAVARSPPDDAVGEPSGTYELFVGKSLDDVFIEEEVTFDDS